MTLSIQNSSARPDSLKNFAFNAKWHPSQFILGTEWRFAPKWSMELTSVSSYLRSGSVIPPIVTPSNNLLLFSMNTLDFKYYLCKPKNPSLFYEGLFVGWSNIVGFRNNISPPNTPFIIGAKLSPMLGYQQRIFAGLFWDFKLVTDILVVNVVDGVGGVQFPLYVAGLSSTLSYRIGL